MENEEKGNEGGIIIGIVSFFSSIISFFVMYYILAIVALVTGFYGINNERSRGLCITSLIITIITFILKIIGAIVDKGMLSEVLLKGFI